MGEKTLPESGAGCPAKKSESHRPPDGHRGLVANDTPGVRPSLPRPGLTISGVPEQGLGQRGWGVQEEAQALGACLEPLVCFARCTRLFSNFTLHRLTMEAWSPI